LAASCAVRADDQRVASPDGETQHDRTRDDDPEDLRRAVSLNRGTVLELVAARAEDCERVAEVDREQEDDGRDERRQHDVRIGLRTRLGALPLVRFAAIFFTGSTFFQLNCRRCANAKRIFRFSSTTSLIVMRREPGRRLTRSERNLSKLYRNIPGLETFENCKISSNAR